MITNLLRLSLLLASASSFTTIGRPCYPKEMSLARSNPQSRWSIPSYNNSSSSSHTRLYFFWFGNKKTKAPPSTNKKDEENDGGGEKSRIKTSSMGKTAETIENFKQAQELGRKTASLLSELSSTSVEGSAARGKIKVLVDGQQKPMGVEIDDDFFLTVNVEDLTEGLASAMQDAHDKSTKLMKDKMDSLYTDIGLPISKK